MVVGILLDALSNDRRRVEAQPIINNIDITDLAKHRLHERDVVFCVTKQIPVHRELAAVLDDSWNSGWEIVYGRPPTDDDFIFPNRFEPDRSHSKSSAYKLWRDACDEAGVTNHSLHSTRHTFTTFARRGTPRTDAVEAITHNKRGELVDYYNHWLWTPIREAMASLSYRADADEHHPLSLVKARGEGPSGSAASAAPPAASSTASSPGEQPNPRRLRQMTMADAKLTARSPPPAHRSKRLQETGKTSA